MNCRLALRSLLQSTLGRTAWGLRHGSGRHRIRRTGLPAVQTRHLLGKPSMARIESYYSDLAPSASNL